MSFSRKKSHGLKKLHDSGEQNLVAISNHGSSSKAAERVISVAFFQSVNLPRVRKQFHLKKEHFNELLVIINTIKVA